MPSTFFGLGVASSGLNAFQAAVNVTANNVANVDTKGYSRQTLNKEAYGAMRVPQRYGSVGMGVNAISVTRTRNQYYNQKYWKNQSNFGYYEQKLYYVSQMEEYFKDEKDVNPGFTTIFTSFNTAMDSLKTHAGDSSYRTQMISEAEKLQQYFNHCATELESLQRDINDEVKTTVEFINASAQKIALLNKQINVIEINGGYANELRDERELVLDELSKIINIETEEYKVENSNDPDKYLGGTVFNVKVNGQRLVDNFEYHELTVTSRKYKHNQSDIDGLYDVTWKETNTTFNVWGSNQKGSLRGLFELRDGNDEMNVRGTVVIDATGSGQGSNGDRFVIEYPNITDPNLLSLPERGAVTVDATEYHYDSFEVQLNKDTGEIERIIFDIVDDETVSGTLLSKAGGKTLTAGSTVNFKGIPYYQNQMNTFVRSYSKEFNSLEKQSRDLYGNTATAFFTAKDKTSNTVLKFSGSEDRKFMVDGKLVEEPEFDGVLVEDGDRSYYSYTSTSDCYYRMTASTFLVNPDISRDPKLFGATKQVGPDENEPGVDAYDIVEKILDLQNKKDIFRSGGAAAYLECIYADITVDTEECRVFLLNYEEIQTAIDRQRKSESGVDEDEEGLNLVKFQNAYNLNAKVISTLTEMYDQLILHTGA